MFRQKRGAVELSVTTIVVVVIGITLLTLGLSWVTGIFEKLDVTTSGAFEQADTQIDEILGGGTGKAISISPSALSLKQGKTTSAKVLVAHIDTIDTSTKSVSVSMTGTSDPNIDCVFADSASGGLSSQTYDLASGYQASITVLISDEGAKLGTYVCGFQVAGFGPSISDTREELIITLVK